MGRRSTEREDWGKLGREGQEGLSRCLSQNGCHINAFCMRKYIIALPLWGKWRFCSVDCPSSASMQSFLSRLAWAIHHSESMNMNAGGGSHGGELREPEGGLASHEACSRQPSCSLIRAPSITLALYSICGSWFSYYWELSFPNFKAQVFIKASEIIFTLQLWFLPIVFYHPGNKTELSSLPWAQQCEL